MLALVFSCHADKGGGHTIFPDFFGGNRPSGDLQAGQIRTQELQIAARVDQRAEDHIAADAAKTIEVSKFRHKPHEQLTKCSLLILSAAQNSVKPSEFAGSSKIAVLTRHVAFSILSDSRPIEN